HRVPVRAGLDIVRAAVRDLHAVVAPLDLAAHRLDLALDGVRHRLAGLGDDRDGARALRAVVDVVERARAADVRELAVELDLVARDRDVAIGRRMAGTHLAGADVPHAREAAPVRREAADAGERDDARDDREWP